MKRVFFILTFLLTFRVVACDCDEPGIIEKYIKSDFVASAKIAKIYDNEAEEELYKSDIQINELFKGKPVQSLYVDGYNGDNLVVGFSSCDIFIPEDTELIVYALKNQKGQYVIGMCSGIVYLKEGQNQRQLDYQKKELQILRTFKIIGLDTANNVSFWNHDLRNRGISDSLDQFDGIALGKGFGIYAMSFNSNLTIDTVEILSGYNKTLDLQLIDTLKNSSWARQMSTKDIHPEKRKQLIGIYFYKAEKDNPSFLSIYYI